MYIITLSFLLISFKNDPIPRKKNIKNIDKAVPLKSEFGVVISSTVSVEADIPEISIKIPNYFYIN